MVSAEVSSPTVEVGAAAREVAHLHTAAAQAAAVPIPPLPPAGPPPGGPAAANVPRPAIADLYSAGPTVFDATAKGADSQHDSEAKPAQCVKPLSSCALFLNCFWDVLMSFICKVLYIPTGCLIGTCSVKCFASCTSRGVVLSNFYLSDHGHFGIVSDACNYLLMNAKVCAVAQSHRRRRRRR